MGRINDRLHENLLRKYAKVASEDDDLLHRGRVEDDFEQVAEEITQLDDRRRLDALSEQDISFCLGWLDGHKHLTDKGLKLRLEDEAVARHKGTAGG